MATSSSSNPFITIPLYDIVIYHKGCPDGRAAAWVYCSIMKEIGISFTQYIPMDAGKYPLDLNVKDKSVLMVDVCPNRNEINIIAKTAKDLTIYDHHKSAQRDVENIGLDNVTVVFAMTRSGCQITWDVFYPDKPRPWFIDIISDRDLWKWEIPNSKELCCYLFSTGYYEDFDDMSLLLKFTEEQKQQAIEVGEILLSIEEKQIVSAVKQSLLTEVDVSGVKYKVRLTGCSHNIASEVGNRLAKMDCDFSAMWRYNYEKDEWWISCRTTKDNIDLSIITRQLGGGGHQKSAGFFIRNSITFDGPLKSFFKEIKNEEEKRD